MKEQNIFGLELIDTGNLLHSAIVSGAFWESIRGKIGSPMDHTVGTADVQSEGLQDLRIGEPWQICISRRNGEVLYPRTPSDTRAEPQSGDSLLAEEQTEDNLHRGGSHTNNACKTQVGLKSPVGGQRISKLYK